VIVREVLERGDLQFFWTPTVQPADGEELALEVQSLFAILSPERGTHRRLRVGKKRMPASPPRGGSSGSSRPPTRPAST